MSGLEEEKSFVICEVIFPSTLSMAIASGSEYVLLRITLITGDPFNVITGGTVSVAKRT
jgi:hypothetical protein